VRYSSEHEVGRPLHPSWMQIELDHVQDIALNLVARSFDGLTIAALAAAKGASVAVEKPIPREPSLEDPGDDC